MNQEAVVTTVYGVNGYEGVYTLPPRDAVLAAFSLHTMRDSNSWAWEDRFGHVVRRSPHGWVAGDFWARA